MVILKIFKNSDGLIDYVVKTNLPGEVCPKVPGCTTTTGIPALLSPTVITWDCYYSCSQSGL